MNGLFQDLMHVVNVLLLLAVLLNIALTGYVAYQVRGYAAGYNAGMNDANVLTGSK
jgi:hypothetical protein